MAATLRRKKGTMCMRVEKEEKSSTERGEKKTGNLYDARGIRVKREKHAPNANCSKTGSKCQEKENSQFWKGR